MGRSLTPYLALILLAGCAGFGPSDPLDDVPELNSLTVSDDAVAIAAPADEPGFFEGLFRRNSTTDTPESAPVEDDGTAEAAAPAGGFFGRLIGGTATGGADATADAAKPGAVPPMTNQPFGEVGTTCGLSSRALGTKIADVSGYKIYDTAPNTTAPRPHYITGFNDRCARQFSAALVLTGDIGTHEVVRYQTAQSRRPYTEADNAYEAIKSSFCRVGFGKPCGSRIDALSRNTTYVTAYRSFASSPVWMEVLLHDGDVAAVSVER